MGASLNGGAFSYLCGKVSIMYIKQFDNGIFMPLIIAVGMSYQDMVNRFSRPKGKEWGNEGDYEVFAAVTTVVEDNEDDGRFKMFIGFSDADEMTVKNIAHESFHAAINMCDFHNMEIGFDHGRDEHAAYIAGWSASCCEKVLNKIKEKGEEENGEEEKEG